MKRYTVEWQPEHIDNTPYTKECCDGPFYLVADVASLVDQNGMLLIHEYDFKKQIAELEAENERLNKAIKSAYGTLQMYGVPELRAKTVANGIMVLVSRIDKETEFQAQMIADKDNKLKETEAENVRLKKAVESLMTYQGIICNAGGWGAVICGAKALAKEEKP